MQYLTDHLMNYKKQVMFRLTITSDQNPVLAYWEPHAPPFEERLAGLKLLFEKGYQTSVSMEPFLSDPISVVTAIEPYITESIWIGTMSGQGHLKSLDPVELKKLQDLYTIKSLTRIVNILANNPKIFWKGRLMELLHKEVNKKGQLDFSKK